MHVIQEKKIIRVGGVRPILLDIRIIAATNKDLKEQVGLGNFRDDLFFRLNVVTIHLPGLVERKDDILLIVKYFIEKYGLAFHKPLKGILPQALEMSNYNTGLTSKILKIPRTTLWRKMKKYNIGNVNPANHTD